MNNFGDALGKIRGLIQLMWVLFAETVVAKTVCEGVVVFGRGDFRKLSIVVNGECVVGVPGGPAAGLDGDTGRSTSLFILVRVRVKSLGRRPFIDGRSAATSSLASRDRRRGWHRPSEQHEEVTATPYLIEEHCRHPLLISPWSPAKITPVPIHAACERQRPSGQKSTQ